MSRRRGTTRAFATALGIALATVGCSSLNDPVSVEDGGADSTTGAGAANAARTFVPVPERRIGSGRAMSAAIHDQLAVVSTTIAVEVRVADEPFRTIATEIPATGRSVDVVGDGNRFVVSGPDGSWELWSSEPEPALLRRTSSVRAFDHHADRIILSTPESIEMIATVDGSTVSSVAIDAGRVASSVVAGNGWWFAALGDGGAPPDQALLVASDGSQQPISFGPDPVAVLDAGRDPSGAHLVVGIAGPDAVVDGRLVRVNSTDGEPAWTIESSVATGSGFFAVGTDGSVVVVDELGPRVVATDGSVALLDLGDAMAPITSAVATSEARFLAFGIDGNARVLDSMGSVLSDVPGLDRTVAPSSTSANGTTVTAIDASGTVNAWTADGQLIERIESYRDAGLRDLAVGRDDQIASSAEDGTVLVFASAADEEPQEFVHPEGNVDSVAFSPIDDTVVTGVSQRRGPIAFDDTVSIWNTTTGDRTHQHGGEAEDVDGCSSFRNVVEFVGDGELVAVASHDFTVSLLDSTSAELVHTFPPHSNTVLAVAASPDGRLLATSSDDSTLRIWDVSSRELVAEHQVTMGGYWSMVFFDAETVVVGDLTGQVSLVEVGTGEIIATFDDVKERNSGLAVSADGAFVAAGAQGNVVRVWSAETGRIVADLAGHDGPVTTTAFTSDGRLLLSGSSDGTMLVWAIA